MSMNSFKQFALVSAAISIAIVGITPVGASSPNDSTTTTAAPAADSTTTTTPVDGATPTTVATTEVTPTTVPGLSNTLLEPLPSGVELSNINQVPNNQEPTSTLPPATP
ncbi:MAG: hypothetical protein ACKOA5_03730, partial [Actinomycetota bacterium]